MAVLTTRFVVRKETTSHHEASLSTQLRIERNKTRKQEIRHRKLLKAETSGHLGSSTSSVTCRHSVTSALSFRATYE